MGDGNCTWCTCATDNHGTIIWTDSDCPIHSKKTSINTGDGFDAWWDGQAIWYPRGVNFASFKNGFEQGAREAWDYLQSCLDAELTRKCKDCPEVHPVYYAKTKKILDYESKIKELERQLRKEKQKWQENSWDMEDRFNKIQDIINE